LDAGGAVPVDVRPGSDVAGATADTGGRLIIRPSEVGAGANFAFTAPVAVLIIA
jgi:Cu+-exporting ATPase